MNTPESQLDRLEKKVDSIDTKLDLHLERLAKAETDLAWLKGHFKIGLSAVVTILTSLVLYYITLKK